METTAQSTSCSIKISYKKKIKYIPQSWDKLSTQQFLKVFEIFNSKIILEEQRIYHIKNLIGMKWKHFKLLTEDQLLDLIPITDFLYDDKEIHLKSNPLQKFTINHIRNYYGVDAELENMTISDYALLDMCIHEYIESKEIRYLYRLAAILYRPKTIRRKLKNAIAEKPIDTRCIINENRLNKRTQYFIDHLPQHLIDAIKFVYLSIQNSLKRDFPYVYKKANDNLSEAEIQNDYGWAAVIIDMAGPKFGTIQQTSIQPLTDIMVVLNRELELEEIRESKRPSVG